MSQLSHDLCSLVPTDIVEFKDGTTVSLYGPYLVACNSDSRIVAWHVPDEAARRNLLSDCQLNDAGKWQVWDLEPTVDEINEDVDTIANQLGEVIFRSDLGILGGPVTAAQVDGHDYLVVDITVDSVEEADTKSEVEPW